MNISKSILLLSVLSTTMFGAIELTESEKDLSVRNVEAKNGVVASAHPLASKVGLEILKKGGNAIDASVGVAFTLGLVEPNASGPGGGGYLLINKDDDQKMYSYYQKAPKGLTREKWDKIKADKTYMTTGVGGIVPGAVAGWLKALDDHGTMEIDEILEPVIDLAEQGFVITPTLARIMGDSYEKLMMSDETSQVFLNDGLPYSEGEVFKNPDYAKTLKLIAKNGRDGFYKGETAEAIKKLNPLITQEDLNNYEPVVVDPIATEYRGYKIVTAAPESCAVALLQALNQVENYDLKKMGEENPDTYHVWAESMNLSQTDRYHYVADPNYETIPDDILGSQKYADIRAEKIKMDSAQGKIDPGYIKKNIAKNNVVEYESPSTTHVSIIDKDGNAVSMTNTIGNFFGYGFVPEDTGFAMNSHFTNFSAKTTYPINMVEPEKRPRSTMSPTFVFDKDEDLKMVIGTPGGTRITSIIPYVISNVIDHDMTMQEAIDFPRIHKVGGKLYIEGGVNQEAIDHLTKLGHNIELKGNNDEYFGGVHGILIEDDVFEGGADPRRDGKALGY